MTRHLLIAASAGALITACAVDPPVRTYPNPQPMGSDYPAAQTYICGYDEVRVWPERDMLYVDVEGDTYTLYRAESASGTMFETRDGYDSVVFWSRGTEAMLEVNGQRYPECYLDEDLAGGPNPYPNAEPVTYELTDREWIIEDIDQRGASDSLQATINFDRDGRIYGFASCNNYNGAYERNGYSLYIDRIAATRKACYGEAADQERAVLDILEATRSYRFTRSGNLVLETADGRSLLAR